MWMPVSLLSNTISLGDIMRQEDQDALNALLAAMRSLERSCASHYLKTRLNEVYRQAEREFDYRDHDENAAIN